MEVIVETVGEKVCEIEEVGEKVRRKEKKGKEKSGSSDVVKRIRAAKGKSTKASSSTSKGSLRYQIFLIVDVTVELPLQGEGQLHPIIDTPNDAFDTAGLISPNPERASLPIIEKKEDKKSSVWTKDKKLEREMASLILPKPEKIVMPAAILPKPDTKVFAVKGKKAESPIVKKEEDHIVEKESIKEKIVLEEESNVTKSAGLVEEDKFAVDAANFLVQLVTLLRDDPKALNLTALKTMVDTIRPATASTSDESPVKESTEENLEKVSKPIKSKEKSKEETVRKSKSKKESTRHHVISTSDDTKVLTPAPPQKSSGEDKPASQEIIAQDMWYDIPYTKKENLEGERISTKAAVTSHERKEMPRRPSTGKLYEPPRFHTAKTDATKIEGTSIYDKYPKRTGALDAYKESFQNVDGDKDLGIVSKAKSTSPITQEDTAMNTIPQSHVPETQKSTVASTSAKEIREVIAPTTPPSKPAPVQFEFNPPTPRRITRRVILTSKDISTQTTPPPTPPPRPRSHIPASAPSIKKDEKRPCMYTSETLPSWAKTRTGSDNVWMGTLKPVDASDDLMITSNPKEEGGNAVGESERKERGEEKVIAEERLYELLKSREERKRDKEERKEKKERRKKEKEERKEKSSKEKKKIRKALLKENVSATGDLIGDLLG